MAAMPGQLELTKLLSQGRALWCAGNKANPPALPNELFSCSFLKPISFNAVYFQNPIVLGTVKTQKHNRSLNPYSQNMSLMHQISLLNQELPPAWKLRAASAFSVAFTEIFLSCFLMPRPESGFLSWPLRWVLSIVRDALSKFFFQASERQLRAGNYRQDSSSVLALAPQDCCITWEWWGEDWCSGEHSSGCSRLLPESPLKGRFRCSRSCWDGWRVNSTWRTINSF